MFLSTASRCSPWLTRIPSYTSKMSKFQQKTRQVRLLHLQPQTRPIEPSSPLLLSHQASVKEPSPTCSLAHKRRLTENQSGPQSKRQRSPFRERLPCQSSILFRFLFLPFKIPCLNRKNSFLLSNVTQWARVGT